VANVPLLLPDAHGGCPQPRGFGDAIVPEWARRNLVTLVEVGLLQEIYGSIAIQQIMMTGAAVSKAI